MGFLALNGKSTYASVASGPTNRFFPAPGKAFGTKNGEWPQIAEEFERQQRKRRISKRWPRKSKEGEETESHEDITRLNPDKIRENP
ncbi:hypothetical protein WR25_04465 [Diploscapter pachys]|uniref:Uncharacterized protein n=1 Tax=Diploscapter pachys TaxID=2018661 RepID=A0A2A2LFU6_9BILA|nr:hypothetical protein WR25_04465 [Diploscapter pachys]